MTNSRDLQRVRDFLRAVMTDLGNQAIAAQSTIVASPKQGRDIVTETDVKLEAQLIDAIKQKFMGDSFEAEERTAEAGISTWTWVIDPIDGTINYAARLSLYSISAALKHEGVTKLAAIYVPSTNEFFWAIKGHGAFVAERKLSAQSTSDIKESVFSVCLNVDFPEHDHSATIKLIDDLANRSRGVRVLVSGALELCYVADGKLSGMVRIKRNLPDWSSDAGILLVLEAGGKVTDLDGNAYVAGANGLIASSSTIHPQLFSSVRSASSNN